MSVTYMHYRRIVRKADMAYGDLCRNLQDQAAFDLAVSTLAKAYILSYVGPRHKAIFHNNYSGFEELLTAPKYRFMNPEEKATAFYQNLKAELNTRENRADAWAFKNGLVRWDKVAIAEKVDQLLPSLQGLHKEDALWVADLLHSQINKMVADLHKDGED